MLRVCPGRQERCRRSCNKGGVQFILGRSKYEPLDLERTSMSIPATRVILWSNRLLIVAIALWWPGLWRDPIYTPRQIRLTGQELRLPEAVELASADERALAIFWMWEHRALVTTRWIVGPYRGLRDVSSRRQTLMVMLVVWVVGSGILFLVSQPAPAPSGGRPRRTSVVHFLTTPLWQLCTHLRRNNLG